MFHLLAIVNSATMNICVQVSESLFSILLSIYLQVVNSMLRDYQTVFHSSYTTLHFHQQYMRVSVSPYPYKFIIHFLNYKHPVDVKWNFIVVLSCISSMTNDFEYFFMCLMTHHLYTLSREMSSPLPIFWVFCLLCWWAVGVLYIFWLLDTC